MKKTVSFGRVLACACALLWSSLAVAKDAVVIVPCHPDDICAAFGFCLLGRDVYDIHVVEFTHGERGCGPVNFTNGMARAIRQAEEEEVCRKLGVTLHWLEEVDGEAHANREVCDQLSEYLNRLKPRAVIGHYPVDIHPDHVMSGAALLRALSNVSTKDYKPEVYFFDQPYQTKAYHADFFLDVSEVFDRKLALMKSYFSQGWGHKYFDPGVSSLEEAMAIKEKAFAARAAREADPASAPKRTSLHRSTCAAYFYAMRTSDLNQAARVEPYVSMFPRQQGQLTVFDQLPQGPRRFNSRFQGAKVGKWAELQKK